MTAHVFVIVFIDKSEEILCFFVVEEQGSYKIAKLLSFMMC